jgi:heme oxygenase
MQNENPATETVSSRSFLDKLRSATSPSHRALEQIPISTALVKPTLTDAIYFDYLSLMRNIVADAEQHIFPQLRNSIPDLETRMKTPLLDRDLAMASITPKHESLPLSAFGPFSDAFAMGIFYVIEGSTLGGRFILKNVSETLGRDENSGASFFYGYGNHTGNYWKNFLAAMAAFESTYQNQDEIIEGAVFAFESIHRHFAQTAAQA